jgi:hypothetical protein
VTVKSSVNLKLSGGGWLTVYVVGVADSFEWGWVLVGGCGLSCE